MDGQLFRPMKVLPQMLVHVADADLHSHCVGGCILRTMQCNPSQGGHLASEHDTSAISIAGAGVQSCLGAPFGKAGNKY